MCVQKTPTRLFLEEWLKQYFKDRTFTIIPFHFNHAVDDESAVLERDNHVFYFGSFYCEGSSFQKIHFFDKNVPYTSFSQDMFFTHFENLSNVSFIGYKISLDVAFVNGEIK